jgi:hypothetical protein
MVAHLVHRFFPRIKKVGMAAMYKSQESSAKEKSVLFEGVLLSQ